VSGAREPGIGAEAVTAAAAAGELFLLYQPKLDLRSGEVRGVEALARWRHPARGEIQPDEFVPAIERGGGIDRLSEWAIDAAVRQWAAWHAAGLALDLSVNISALNLKHTCFPDAVSAIAGAHAMPAERLTLELTEGATLDSTRLMDATSRIRLKGMGISLDDFGTGYGSLVQLRGLPFTELKIDRSFVADLTVSRDSRAITRGLIRIAHDLGLSVAAEGVEDQATLDALVSFGCDMAQGFYIARPMAGHRIESFVRSSGAAAASRPEKMPRRRTGA
jgi:EAL domain-containing protein (putative c-di-GMP-specific phosphodiesterase class I)